MSKAKIEIIQGDIVQQQVDVIVNAANKSLLGGGGVDGAIHRAAGPDLLEECKKLNGCNTGEAKITKAYGLPSKWIVHAVGPVWQGGSNNEDELLASAYRHSLEVAAGAGARSVAFPSISTGAYGFPVERAAAVAIRTINDFIKDERFFDKVVMVCFDDHTKAAYEKALSSLKPHSP